MDCTTGTFHFSMNIDYMQGFAWHFSLFKGAFKDIL